MTPAHPRPPRQRGAALLVAMITVALVATIASTALWQHWRAVEVESAERTRVQADWILSGALDWARLILEGDASEDRRNSPAIDHLAEPWAVPLAEARLSTFLAAGQSSADLDRDAFLSGQITDLQGRLNVMNLALDNPEQQAAAEARFERLYQALGLPTAGLRPMQTALIRARRAMRADAPGGDAPLLPTRLNQLTWLGVDPKTIEQLRPYATLLAPGSELPTPVNINTASAEAIYAALPALNMAQARALVDARAHGAFTSVPQALQALGMPTEQIEWGAVRTQYFLIQARLRLDDMAVEERAAVERSANGNVITLWRERTALQLTDTDTAKL